MLEMEQNSSKLAVSTQHECEKLFPFGFRPFMSRSVDHSVVTISENRCERSYFKLKY